MNSPAESVNHRTMQSAVSHYAAAKGIGNAERNAFSSIAREFHGKRILDIGVGGGRTVDALLEISHDYVGADYVQEMVDHCRSRHPHVRFELADARAMPQFADASFDVAVFAWAGICMVDHEGRLAILREIRRVLSPEGVFVFSTFNRNSREHDSWFRFPGFRRPKRLLRWPEAMARYLVRTLICAGNRLRYLRHEKATAGYSIINDQFHEYRTMHYYITFDEQIRQLAAHGFDQCTCYDAAGNLVDRDNGALGDSFLLVARTSPVVGQSNQA